MSKATENTIYQGKGKVHLRVRNRRIIIHKEDDFYGIILIRTTTPEEREIIKKSENVKLYAGGKIMCTFLKLNRETLENLYYALYKFFEEETQ